MTPRQPVRATVRDVRDVPLAELAQAVRDGALKRDTPTADGHVPVAAFNASL